MPVAPWLLEILACPRCLSPLDERDSTLVCTATTPQGCGLVYPIRDGIPVLLIDEASDPADGSVSSPGEGGESA